MKATDLVRLNIEIENHIDADGDLLPLPGKGSTIFLAGCFLASKKEALSLPARMESRHTPYFISLLGAKESSMSVWDS